MEEYFSLKQKVQEYHEVLHNTERYRQIWRKELRDFIISELEKMIKATGLEATLTTRDTIGNLEALICTMGKRASGIFERVDEDTNKPIIKHFGALVYQQLFNGKIQVLIMLPALEGMPDQRQPKFVGIYRPEELKPPFLERHMEEFVRSLTEWEDFDDDEQPNKIGFQMPGLQLED
ncbi:MAG: hypothetical protein R3301_18875 [Saprospiraceae bacterium]|nr:hypothetical protein [Saprospiraceae bacterium]